MGFIKAWDKRMHLSPPIPSSNSFYYFSVKSVCEQPDVSDCNNNTNTSQLSFEILRWYSSVE
jgi:hypothetical protein